MIQGDQKLIVETAFGLARQLLRVQPVKIDFEVLHCKIRQLDSFVFCFFPVVRQGCADELGGCGGNVFVDCELFRARADTDDQHITVVEPVLPVSSCQLAAVSLTIHTAGAYGVACPPWWAERSGVVADMDVDADEFVDVDIEVMGVAPASV